MGRVELECVGVTEAREEWVRAWDGAAMVGEHRAQASFARRGQGRSVASIFVFGLQLFDDGSGGSGSWLVTFVGILEAAYEGVSGGAGRGRGAASIARLLGRSPARTGINVGDMAAGHTVMYFGNSSRGEHGQWR